MDPTTIYLIKTALYVLSQCDRHGVDERALLEQTRITAQQTITSTEQHIIMNLIREKGWANSYRDTMMGGSIRYILSDRGRMTLESL